MKKYTLGVVAGASVIVLAVPFFIQISNAQDSENLRPIPSQACVLAMAAREDAMIATHESLQAARKVAMLAHSAALKAAGAIIDDTQRQSALKNAEETFKAAMEATVKSQENSVKSENEAVKAACGEQGKPRGLGMGMGMMREKFGKQFENRGESARFDGLAEKLGLTSEELKSEMKAGKTIEQIAQEHGVTLPGNSAMRRGWFKNFGASSSN